MSALSVRRAKAVLSSGCKPHPATAPAGSNRRSYGGEANSSSNALASFRSSVSKPSVNQQ
jgi:hypothetical protein